MIKKIFTGLLFISIISLYSCQNNSATNDDSNDNVEVKTPVTAVMVSNQNLQDGIWLNASVVYQKKSVVKSSINGYVSSTSLVPGQTVQKGQILFKLKTKEAQIIGNQLPDSLQFNGNIIIRASQSGFISELDHQQGDYVQDGEQLCIIADRNSYGLMLQVPYSLSTHIVPGGQVPILLPTGQQLTGRVAYRMPLVDSVSQTQQYFITPTPFVSLPENLIVKVWIVKSAGHDVQVLPKSAVLSDEAESQFWVMEMINDTTAVKVPVKTGIEDSTLVEIVSPKFAPGDKILNTGNYGLPDTAFVTLTQSAAP